MHIKDFDAHAITWDKLLNNTHGYSYNVENLFLMIDACWDKMNRSIEDELKMMKVLVLKLSIMMNFKLKEQIRLLKE